MSWVPHNGPNRSEYDDYLTELGWIKILLQGL